MQHPLFKYLSANEVDRGMRKRFFETSLTLQFSVVKSFITHDSIVLARYHVLNLLKPFLHYTITNINQVIGR